MSNKLLKAIIRELCQNRDEIEALEKKAYGEIWISVQNAAPHLVKITQSHLIKGE